MKRDMTWSRGRGRAESLTASDVEYWSEKAKIVLRRVPLSEGDKRVAIRFLGMAKRRGPVPTWAKDTLEEAFQYPDFDPNTGEPFWVIER